MQSSFSLHHPVEHYSNAQFQTTEERQARTVESFVILVFHTVPTHKRSNLWHGRLRVLESVTHRTKADASVIKLRRPDVTVLLSILFTRQGVTLKKTVTASAISSGAVTEILHGWVS